MAPIRDPLSSALSGIQQGLRTASERAERISSGISPVGSESFTEDLIGFKQDLYTVGANRKVITVLQEMDKSVLDILA